MTVSRAFFFVITCYLFFAHKCSNAEFDASISLNNDSVLQSEWHNTGNHTIDSLQTWTIISNSTKLLRANKAEIQEVDCLGLGSRIARILHWFFVGKCKQCNNLDVKFYFSSRQQPNRVQVMVGEQFGLEWTDFKMERKTVVIVHGFLSSGNQEWVINMEKAFLIWGDVNVIVVDWSAGGNSWNYYKAVIYTKIVGRQISRLLGQIVNATLATENTDMSKWGDIHLVGHSLGAHICGYVCSNVKSAPHSWVIRRVTGLDPAQPCFKTNNTEFLLDKHDAEFVDVIHTNGRLLSRLGLGISKPIGHADFYPNGGMSQPGCSMGSTPFNFLPITPGKIRETICSHGRSYYYLTESLISATTQNCTFWAHHWNMTYRDVSKLLTQSCTQENCSMMGITAENYPQRGTFYVATSDMSPFCLGNTAVNKSIPLDMAPDFADELQD